MLGCDIHLRVETRDPSTGRWSASLDAFEEWTAECRDYTVFAKLAGVRNERGLVPWFPDRGLPTDLDPTLLDASACDGFGHVGLPRPVRFEGEPQEAFDERCNTYEEACEGLKWLGEHSFTWATVAELRAADWGETIHVTALVERAEYVRWKASDDEAPYDWQRQVFGARTIAEESVDGKPLPDADYIRCQWSYHPLAVSAFKGWLFGDGITERVDVFGAENVRLLMGFDS